ncbi:MAG: coiled-coil domain-containing protein, partial [Actinomycetota bacterium]
MSGTRMGRAAAAVVALTLALSPIAGGTPTLAAPSRAELDAARDRLHELEREFQLVSERYNLVNERLSGLIARIGATELEIKKLERRMTGRRDAAIAVATELYMGGSSVALEAVLTSDTLADIETRLTYLESTESAQARVFERLANDRAVLQAKVVALEEAQARAAAARSTLAELASGIEERAADQRDEVARLNDLIARAEARAEARAAAEA